MPRPAFPSPVSLSDRVSLRCSWSSESPSSFLRSVPCLGSPFAPRGPSSVGSLASSLLRAARTSRRPLRCVEPTTLGASLRLPSLGATASAETTGPPRFLENPRLHAALFDPGEIVDSGHSGVALLIESLMLPSTYSTASALTVASFGARSRGLQPCCLRFVARVALCRDARLASGW